MNRVASAGAWIGKNLKKGNRITPIAILIPDGIIREQPPPAAE
jgi:hypothetical protein